jgi:ADP-ribose pyrophosphatase YjhB (NUDIX family)
VSAGAATETGQPIPDPAALPWVRIGAYAVVTDRESGPGVGTPPWRILLVRIAPGYPLEGHWTLPGGGVDFGEHPDAAVLRELREETGLEGERGPILCVVSGTVERPSSRPGPLHWVAILYRVERCRGEARDEPDGSSDRCGWFLPAEARSLPHVDLVDAALDALAADG